MLPTQIKNMDLELRSYHQEPIHAAISILLIRLILGKIIQELLEYLRIIFCIKMEK